MKILLSGVAIAVLTVMSRPAADSQAPWDRATADQLRSFRCDLGGMRVDGLGPRDAKAFGGPSDYVFTPTYPTWDPAERARMRAAVKARGYTHFAIGPIWEAGYPGWPGHDFRDRPDAWEDLLEELWRDGLVPVQWIMPNGPYNQGGVPDQHVDWARVDRELTPIFRRARMQALSRVVVFGWEVTDRAWINRIDTAVDAVRWLARVFPDAYRYWHMGASHFAPCDREVEGRDCAARAWRAIAPWITGSFWHDGSFGGWSLADGRQADREADRRAQFLDNLAYEVRRFRTDHYAPGGLQGAHGPLDVIAGEYSAYFERVDRRSEAEARAYGRLAMGVDGVRGFCDGG